MVRDNEFSKGQRRPQNQQTMQQGFAQGQQPTQQGFSQQPQQQGFSQQVRQQPQQQSSGQPQMRQQSQQQSSGQPPHRDYNASAQSGARVAQGQQINRNFAQPGQTLQQGQPVQQDRPMNNQQMQAQQNQFQSQQPRQMQQNQQMPMNNVMQNQQMPQQQPPNGGNPINARGRKIKNRSNNSGGGKKKVILIIVAVLVLIVGVCAVIKIKNERAKAAEEAVPDYLTTGKYAFDELLNALHNGWNAETIDSYVGTEDGDSWLAQEWAYVNGVGLREEYLQKVGSLCQFSYPNDTMNGGEPITVTVPDYSAFMELMNNDAKYIGKLWQAKVDKVGNLYKSHDDMFDIMMQYMCDSETFPTKTVEVTMNVRLSTDGVPYIVDDAPLDDALFGNEEFREMAELFSRYALDFKGVREETYVEKEEQHNEEWDAWQELFMKYYAQDGGTYDEATNTYHGGKFTKNSKWEPFFLRKKDENGNIILDENGMAEIVLDENGEKVVDYYTVKDENGKDWIQPDKTILVDVEKTREVEFPWENETGIYHNNLGIHYIQTEYDGKGSKIFRVGDGSFERPAGIGTTIITKALGDDGKFHDVEVALIAYWIDQDAIDYAETFSTRNRGFTTVSVVQLITCEMTVKNLEANPITIQSEFTLCDKNSNISSRTGTMYGFSGDSITIEPEETVTINDWYSSTELKQKYACWGKNFGREYSVLYFDALAGTGVVPSYSAYKQFVGTSTMYTTDVNESEEVVVPKDDEEEEDEDKEE